jgi:NtrC-family two-component system response regulator AlgB
MAMPIDAEPPAPRVVALDRDHRARRSLALQLEGLGCRVEQAATGAEALDLVRCQPFSLAICDLGFVDEGHDLIPELLAQQPQLAIVVIDRDPSVEAAGEAVRRGATDFLAKPLTSVQVQGLVEFARRRAMEPAATHPEDLLDLTVPLAARDLLRRAASCDFPALIRGEHGTGKGAVARAIHERGVRRGSPLAEVDARAVRSPEGLLPRRVAEGGTLLVAEVGDLDRPLQEELLRQLREGARSTGLQHGGVRILATASGDLVAKARAGAFHLDLLHELTALEIELPPLRARPLEIVPLAGALAAEIARRRGVTPPTFSPAARRLLVTWPWPGNVRELRGLLERAVSADRGGVLGTDAFPEWMAVRAGDAPAVGAPLTLQELEREHVTRVVAWASSFDEAARVLGMDPSTVRRKLRTWEVRGWRENATSLDGRPAGGGGAG